MVKKKLSRRLIVNNKRFKTYLKANNKQIDLTRVKIMKIKKEAINILSMFVLLTLIFIASIYGLL